MHDREVKGEVVKAFPSFFPNTLRECKNLGGCGGAKPPTSALNDCKTDI